MAKEIDYKQTFMRFLKAKNAYEAFMYNVNCFTARKKRMINMFSLNTPDLFILQAFDWGCGVGTVEYWHNLHKQWKSVVLGKRLQDF